jgi:hypothetical protein
MAAMMAALMISPFALVLASEMNPAMSTSLLGVVQKTGVARGLQLGRLWAPTIATKRRSNGA